MKPTDCGATSSRESAKVTIDDILADIFHDAQNAVHLVGMELELMNMGLGNSSDAVKAAGIVKLLEHHLRDLRGYVSALQDPTASCDPAVILDGVIASVLARKRKDEIKLAARVPESLPMVVAHPKLLTRVLERVFEYSEDLLDRGGELAVWAAKSHGEGETYAEIGLTIRSGKDIRVSAEEELDPGRSARRTSNRGIQRALEVLRRHGGQTTFRRDSDRQCRLSLRILASPK
jgi:hypothetical protein